VRPHRCARPSARQVRALERRDSVRRSEPEEVQILATVPASPGWVVEWRDGRSRPAEPVIAFMITLEGEDVRTWPITVDGVVDIDDGPPYRLHGPENEQEEDRLNKQNGRPERLKVRSKTSGATR
jgi:hypothetical protein